MPVNLTVPTDVYQVAGVQLASVAAGLKKNGAPDLVLITLPESSISAGVFTRNTYCAAPVTVCREHLNQGQNIRALLVNSGGANAATGDQGATNAIECCQIVAERLDLAVEAVLPFSTGVIGEQLPMPLMRKGIDALLPKLSDAAWLEAATGIMTTDTMPKLASRRVSVSTGEITLAGFAKGSGMIQPDMATMLAYLFTDATIAADDLQGALVAAAESSFNSVTIDGDTSTNDSCILSATGSSGAAALEPDTDDWRLFITALNSLSVELAQAIVRDGEGATKFITLQVTGGRTEADCKQVGLTVGNSPLVKTAFFASDANVGRIVMAVGRAGIELDINTLSFALGGVDVLLRGQPASDYTDEQGQVEMAKSEIDVTIDLGQGDASWTVWTCDLSHDYVSINADYRS